MLLEAPDVDRARIDPTQIVCVEVAISTKGMYRVATRKGVLYNWYNRADLHAQHQSTPTNHGLEAILQQAVTDLASIPVVSIT